MINPSIHRLILGKREADAVQILKKFKCQFRIMSRDGAGGGHLSDDRNDDRYNLVITNGVVSGVVAG